MSKYREKRFNDKLESTKDQRSNYSRDRDRVLYSLSLRRLAGVTQVSSAEEGYLFHNRLTHTLLVSQLAKRISEYIISKYSNNYLSTIGDIDPEVAETAALIHDLGHPPFGHLGEQTLNELAKSKGLSDGFEGNAQSFRIVTTIENRYEGKNVQGLNLTRATLNASLKYPYLKKKNNDKFGAYKTEEKIFKWVRKYSIKEKLSLEAEIMNYADDIAYSVHDFEDFYRAGFIPLVDLLNSQGGEYGEYRRFKLYLIDYYKIKKDTDFRKYEKGINNLFQYFKTYFVERYKGYPEQHSILKQVCSMLISEFVRDGFKLSKPKKKKDNTLIVDEQYQVRMNILKALTRYYVIDHPSLASQQQGQRIMITKIFDTCCEKKKNGNLNIFPEPYRTVIKTHKSKKDKLRVLVDYISGMTESQVINMYRRITGIDLGSIYTSIV